MNTELARYNMIEQQIRPWDVLDADVLALLAVVRREDFVPPSYSALAFVDTEVPLPSKSGVAQAMLSPKVEARLLQELNLRKHERVLEVGAGSGHMAALLAHQAQHVTTVDIDPSLADMARSNLARAGVANVTVRIADAAQGLPDDGPFDAIVLSGSVAAVPAALLAKLRAGGRLIAIVGTLPIMRARLYTCASPPDCAAVDLFDTVAPRLTGFDEPSRFRF